MTYEKFKKSILTHLAKYKIDVLNITENGISKTQKLSYDHIIPDNLIKKNFLTIPRNNIALYENKLHKDAHHMNSSQVMCINFFDPMLYTNEGMKLLKDIITKGVGKDINGDDIIKAAFEFIPNGIERTHFDFYIETIKGVKIYFEIKYTENGFSSTKVNIKQWDRIHKKHLSESFYVRDYSPEEFYMKNYQFNRNVSYIKKPTDYAVFIVPADNTKIINKYNSGIEKIKQHCHNVKLVVWDNLVESALTLSTEYNLHTHFKEFNNKYLMYK